MLVLTVRDDTFQTVEDHHDHVHFHCFQTDPYDPRSAISSCNKTIVTKTTMGYHPGTELHQHDAIFKYTGFRGKTYYF